MARTYDRRCLDQLKATVVMQACDDWLREASGMQRTKEGSLAWSKHKDKKESCEKFFFSERFCLFSDIDPFVLLDRLEALLENGITKLPKKKHRPGML